MNTKCIHMFSVFPVCPSLYTCGTTLGLLGLSSERKQLWANNPGGASVFLTILYYQSHITQQQSPKPNRNEFSQKGRLSSIGDIFCHPHPKSHEFLEVFLPVTNDRYSFWASGMSCSIPESAHEIILYKKSQPQD